MNLPVIPLGQWQTFLICLVRIAALIGSMPVFSGSQAPARMRAGLAFILAIVIFPVVKSNIPQESLAPFSLGLLVVKETMFGIMLGFIARLILIAIQFGGTVAGYKMGFAAANILDPQSHQQVPLMGRFLQVIAILVFLSIDGHHIFLRALVHSYEILPPGNLDFSGQAIPYLMDLTGDMFALGLQLTAPLLVMLILSHFVLGIMSRLMPQLNVLMLSFPINIGLGFIVLGLSFNMIVALLSQEFQALSERFFQFFQML